MTERRHIIILRVCCVVALLTGAGSVFIGYQQAALTRRALDEVRHQICHRKYDVQKLKLADAVLNGDIDRKDLLDAMGDIEYAEDATCDGVQT